VREWLATLLARFSKGEASTLDGQAPSAP
jgi:hypothetical protein